MVDSGVRGQRQVPMRPSARGVERSMTWSLVVFCSGFLLLPLALLIPGALVPLIVVSVILAAGGGIVLLVQMALLPRQRSLELQARYTTLEGRLRDADLVDDRTGIVLRRAGEPILTPEEHQARLTAARASGGGR